MTWTNGRRLATISATNDHAALSFTYDSDGLRLKKIVGTGSSEVEHRYTWQGSKLIAEQYGTTTLEFFYDESGAPYALLVRDTSTATPTETWYYYVTNLQGDVMQILDASGNTVATYTYNAWGEVLNLTNNTSANIGDLNPIRYRGYYYDTETGFYYLKSRYYDPKICRFINLDGLASTGQGFLGANMFVYCLNEPSNTRDDKGDRPSFDVLLSDSGQQTDAGKAFIRQIEVRMENANRLASLPAVGGVGLSGAAGFGLMYTGSVAFVSDKNGNYGIALTPGFGGGFGKSIGVSLYTSKDVNHFVNLDLRDRIRTDAILGISFKSDNGRPFITPLGELLVRRIPPKLKRELLVDSDLLCCYVSYMNKNEFGKDWFPFTYLYKQSDYIDYFTRLNSKKYFNKIKKVFDVDSADEFKEKVLSTHDTLLFSRGVRFGNAWGDCVEPVESYIDLDKICNER